MISVNVTGTLGKYGYQNIPDEISDMILQVSTETAYLAAVSAAPYDPEPDGVHIKEDLQWRFISMLKLGVVWIKSAYANITEYGSKSRLPHPYMRKGAAAARSKMRSTIRSATKEVVTKNKKA